jgi:hypothetical protein
MERRVEEVMEMAKKRKSLEWPKVLYMTPDKWSPFGKVFVVDEGGLRQMVKELRNLGEDWCKVSVGDATPIHMVSVDDDNDDRAVYKGEGGELYKVWRYRFPDGEVCYDWCELVIYKRKDERRQKG